MQIYGPSQVHGPHGVKGPHSSRGVSSAGSASANRGSDEVQFSAAAEAAASAAEAGDVRADLVARVRAQIADGSYETPDKLDAALSRLLDEIG
ncbi:MAG: flagellar biosynthesis anti-sigma factor FlgM [Pirellulales bacterium]|nr:flagellar biosynthesis anti-sigma factor FlgM [Pirellulales bacterium]MBX3434313.1 flagellar biosynthesis anti-sigma factor FlgM [Pirellulales bacterium]